MFHDNQSLTTYLQRVLNAAARVVSAWRQEVWPQTDAADTCRALVARRT